MLQGPEIIVIVLVALVVFGPERLPDLARKAGRWASELRNAARDIRQGLESEVGDVRDIANEVTAPMKEVKEQMRDARGAVDDTVRPIRWIGPEPSSGPSSKDAMADLSDIEEKGGTTDEEGTAAG